MHRVTRLEYEQTLRFWSQKHSDRLVVEEVGKSAEGMPIFLLSITDRSVPDNDKQVCLISSLHGGPERSGTTTILHLTEWLLSDDSEAAEVRRKQIVLLMPIINPNAFFVTDRFGNAHGIDPYTGSGPKNWDLKTMTFMAADKSPEIMAFLSVIDRYQPEVNADIHGIGLQEYPEDKLGERRMYQGQTMFEITGSAYSNYTLRPWDWRVTEAMIAAGKAAGYGSDRFEADAQQCFWGPDAQPIADRFWLGRPRFYTAQVAYAKYHTMVMACEVGWEESGVARLKGLLRIGNNVWEGEPIAGYPVDRVKSFCGHFVAAWGQTADERRRSRVELWNRQGAFTMAMLYPQTDGRDTFVCAVGREADKRLDPDKAKFVAGLRDREGFRAEAIRAFVDDGPELKFYVARGRADGAQRDRPITNGMALRLRLPYRSPELLDLRLNGHLLAESRTDGFHKWFADGYTQVQINIPPDKTREGGLFVVTCAYKPDVRRTYGWKPPLEVTNRSGSGG
ncbi:MAG: hypothetical protein JXQ73_25190 [Phycisphaerae bacterium]|nr:hypothetical protein [Phycisphaerae bacterium]